MTAVGLDPDYLYSYTRRGQILLARGTVDLARADFDKVGAQAMGAAGEGP